MKLLPPAGGRAIALAPTSTLIPVDQALEVTGWGVVSENGKSSRDLLVAHVPYVSIESCNASNAYDGKIQASMLCAGSREGGVDSCQGDSGGPLVWRTSRGPLLVGIVSHGEGCARKLKYGVYTRISEFRTWIDKVISEY